MNTLTSLQRKLLYLGGVILLLIPITWLGRPPEPAPGGRIEPGSGGKLAQLRIEHQLGEASLGDVDPASSTMSLLLLGFRGVATSMLWMDAQEQQKIKDWSALRATTDSIILLQPHFLKVWHFQGWNLAYNVSAEWDLVPDRYYWVKEGIKFFKKGKDRNEKYSELYWYTGDTIGKKVGRSDEWAQFRKYFRNDPDKIRYPNGPDPEINPEGKDNYLEAKKWFITANEIIDRYHNMEHIMTEILFRQYPQRAQMDYAMARQREGDFDEITRVAWDEGFQEWTQIYGRVPFDNPGGNGLHLEPTEAELAEIRKADADKPEGQRTEEWIERYRSMTNYRYWRTRAKVESEPLMAEAHRELYEGERLTRAADYTQARELLWNGMTKLEEILTKYPDLSSEDMAVEEALLAQLFWRDCLEVEEEVPDETEGYPLQGLWNAKKDHLPSVTEEFNRRKRGLR
ncbi:MAG TPA: hypothetical protein VL475_13005 [Planctomycetaceae bacterium]|nr:hypothetical protein [Planctomycetaceae bacterium]